jgi:hypothetical protein
MSQSPGGLPAAYASNRSRTAWEFLLFSPESPTTQTRTGAVEPVWGAVVKQYVASGGEMSAEGWPTAYA